MTKKHNRVGWDENGKYWFHPYVTVLGVMDEVESFAMAMTDYIKRAAPESSPELDAMILAAHRATRDKEKE